MGDPTMTNILLGAVTGLSGVVAFLYKQQTAYHLDTVKRLSDCEEDRLDLWKQLAGLESKVRKLQAGEHDESSNS